MVPTLKIILIFITLKILPLSMSTNLGKASIFGSKSTPLENVVSLKEDLDCDNDPWKKICYLGCYHIWQEQNTKLVLPFNNLEFDEKYTHKSCVASCQLKKKLISFLRGAQCLCADITDFRSKLITRDYCNISCPIRDHYSGEGDTKISGNEPDRPCGGNVGYAVYCFDEDNKGQCEGLHYNTQTLHRPNVVYNIKRYQRPQKLYSYCAQCDNCEDDPTSEISDSCALDNFSPEFNYFPTNTPEDCVNYCAHELEPPTRFAILMWGTESQKLSSGELPICRCVGESLIENLYKETSNENCDTPCPAQKEKICGGKVSRVSGVIRTLFASVYCTKSEATGTCGEGEVTTTKISSTSATSHPCTITSTTTGMITTTPTFTTTISTTNGMITTTPTPTPAISTTNGMITTTPTPTPPISTTTSMIISSQSTITLTTSATTRKIITSTTTGLLPSTTTPTITIPPITVSTVLGSTFITTTFHSTTTRRTTTSTTIESTSSLLTTLNPITCSKHCRETDKYGQKWNVCSNNAGYKPCSELRANTNGIATWRCSEDRQFETTSPNVSLCQSRWLQDKREELEGIVNLTHAHDYMNELAEDLRNADEVNSRTKYFGHEIDDITFLVQGTLCKEYSRRSPSQRERLSDTLELLVKKGVAIYSYLIYYMDPWNDLSLRLKSFMFTNVSSSLEAALFQLTRTSSIQLPYNWSLSPHDNLLVMAESFKKEVSGENDDYEFPSEQHKINFTGDDQETHIKLPAGWQKLVRQNQVQIAGILIHSRYVNSIIGAEGMGELQLNGKLISLSVKSHLSPVPGNSEGNRTCETQAGDRLIFGKDGAQITFKHDLEAWGKEKVTLFRNLHEGENPSAVLGTAQCVYWDVTMMMWSTRGCRVLKSTRFQTTCQCDHLTAFAVLMDIHNYAGKNKVMEWLTIILCPTSELALLLTIIVLCIATRITTTGAPKVRATINKHLAGCLFVGNGLVMFVLDKHYFNLTKDQCTAAAIVTHYIFLSAFMWMLIEGIQLHRMVIHVFYTNGKTYIVHFIMISYGTPLIGVGITAIVGYLHGDLPYGSDVYCWLQGNYMWAFMGPVGVVVGVNLIFLFIALKTSLQVQRSRINLIERQVTVANIRSRLKGCFSLTVSLGLTWSVGFYMLMNPPEGIIFSYMFTALNASQGLLLFLLNWRIFTDQLKSFKRRKVSIPIPSRLPPPPESTLSNNTTSNANVQNETRDPINVLTNIEDRNRMANFGGQSTSTADFPENLFEQRRRRQIRRSMGHMLPMTLWE